LITRDTQSGKRERERKKGQGVLVKKRRTWHWPGLCRRVKRWLGDKGWQAANKGKELGRAIKIAVYSETFLKIQSSLKCTQNIQ